MYVGTVALLSVPVVQRKVALAVTNELSVFLNTKVSVGRINLGFLNRIIIDDVLVDDLSGKEMIKVSRLSAKYDIASLFQGRISIGTVQLFGFDVNLNRLTPEADVNFQFLLDAFASEDTIKKESNLDLRINSLLVRRGKIAYDVLSEEETPGKFNPNHIKLYNLLGNISLKALKKDTINAQVRRFSVDEQSGLELRKLNLKVIGNDNHLLLEDLMVELPGTSLQMDTIAFAYDSLGSLTKFNTKVSFDFKTQNSYLTLQDFTPFVPAFANFSEKVNLKIEGYGNLDDITCNYLNIYADSHLSLRGEINLQNLSTPEDAYIYGKLSNFSATKEGVEFLARNLSKQNSKTPTILTRLGDVAFKGDITGYFTDLVMYGNFRSDVGMVDGDVKLSADKEAGTFSYSGNLMTADFQLGKLLAEENLGNVTFDLDVNSTLKAGEYPYLMLKGVIESIEYSQYNYNNITLDGEFINGGFDGKVALEDENGSFYLNGYINTAETIPAFNFNAELKKARLHSLNLTPDKYKDTEISLKVNADFYGNNIDDVIGQLDIDSFIFNGPEKDYFMENMRITSRQINGKKALALRSHLITADVVGEYSYKDLTNSVLNIIRTYLPTVFEKPDRASFVPTHNNFEFNVQIFDTEILPVVFDIPLYIYSHSTIRGYVSDTNNKIQLDGYFPRMSYGKSFIESGVINCSNLNDALSGHIRFSNYRKGGVVNYSFDLQGKDNELTTRFNWGNNAAVTYSGVLEAKTSFSTDEEKAVSAIVDIYPTNVILNDTIWKIHPSQIVASKGSVSVNNFNFAHEDQFLRINGIISDQPEELLQVDLKEVSLGYIFNILLPSVDFKGSATGSAFLVSALKDPVMNTNLHIRNFSFNNGLLGDMDISGEWDEGQEGIHLVANIAEEEISKTHVTGYIYPLRPKSGLDLFIDANRTNIKFIEHFIDGLFRDVDGRGSGKVRLFGGFSSLNLDGSVMTEADVFINTLKIPVTLKDSIHLSPGGITLKNLAITGANGQGSGLVNGNVSYKHFKNLQYDISVNVDNMQVMNISEYDDFPFYGTAYCTGNTTLRGNGQELTVNAAVTTNRNTTFVYSLAPASSAVGTQFISFNDKTPTRIFLQDSLQVSNGFDFTQRLPDNEEEDEDELDIRLNIQVDATPEAQVRVIMDPVSGDYIAGRGYGNLRADFYNKGDFRMFGSYDITQGIYKFSLQEVIRKDFTIKDGSSVNFNGSMENANLNVQAAYLVNTVSLSDLGLDTSDRNPNVRVNCLMNLAGSLDRPDISLAIELPYESDELQAQVRNIVNTEEDISMQFLYLLAIGKFYTPNYINIAQSSKIMPSALFSTLSGQLNNMISQIFNSNNWNIGTNLSTGEEGWTDVEIEGVLSAQLLNNRLLINGNFGYRDNPLANSNFVGDFDVEWLLMPSGEIRLKAYNQTNNRIMLRNSLSTQGIGIVFRKDFNRWSDLFFWRRKRIATTQATTTNTDEGN
ncbi:translocation/assembly module TamB [Bacteroides sp. 214]|nr:translocation/assembly module TamB [Bacteroides sp. 214]